MVNVVTKLVLEWQLHASLSKTKIVYYVWKWMRHLIENGNRWREIVEKTDKSESGILCRMVNILNKLVSEWHLLAFLPKIITVYCDRKWMSSNWEWYQMDNNAIKHSLNS
jgi:hypothetical protein